MRLLITIFFGLFALLQYRLWVVEDGLYYIEQLEQDIYDQQEINTKLKRQNKQQQDIVTGLKIDENYVEEFTRSSLGLIRPGETVFLLTEQDE